MCIAQLSRSVVAVLGGMLSQYENESKSYVLQHSITGAHSPTCFKL